MPSRHARTIASTLALLFAVAPVAVAHAQTDDTTTAPPPKKPKKKKPKATPAPAPVEETPAPPPPVAEPTPPAPTPAPTPAADLAPPAAIVTTELNTDVYEKPGKTYYFLGLRYRGDVIPAFMIHLFANDGKTFYSNTLGVELDIRRDGFSMIPWLVYTTYGSGGDTLFWQKNQPDLPQYYSDINSSLKAVYAGVDLKWSKDISKNVQFEYGAGFGLGVILGSLGDNWVYQTANGPLTGSNGQHYAPCQTGDTELGCNKGDHQNASVAKVGGYVEKSWFGGGSVPAFFPYISVPELGIRYKPIKQLETRLTVGFSLTGFFFGLSGAYGFPEKPHSEPVSPSGSTGEAR